MEGRRATVALQYNGVNASGQVAPFLRSFKFSDVACGSSDSIDITLNDRDRRWIGPWFPVKGDRLSPTIRLNDWERDGRDLSIGCGSFCVDDFSFKGNPITLSLKGVAIPATSGFKTTKRSITYESTTLKEIGRSVAERAGISLFYDAEEIAVEKVEQSNQADCEFYNSLVEKYGLAMKIYSNRLVVFSEAAYEAKPVVAVLTEADFEPGWSWATSTTGTYTGVKYEYNNSEKDQTFTVEIGTMDRPLTCNEAAENMTEATLIAQAALNKANRSTTTMKITVKAHPRFYATACVEITGLGRLSGKYYIDQADTSLGDSTKTSLSLRRIEARYVKADSDIAQEEGETAGNSGGASGEPVDTSGMSKGGTYVLTVTKKGYYTAAEAAAGAATGGHPTGTVPAGTYTIYNTSQGMLNLTRVAGTHGSWINPN